MYYAGLDLGSRESFIHVVDSKGKKVSRGRVAMSREALGSAFCPYLGPGICVALETGGSSRWVAEHLIEIGVREVHVVNPNRLRLIAESRKKTDKADAKLLAELYRLDGLPEPVHLPSPEAREMRMLIKARSGLVEGRTKLINTVRGFLRGQGVTSGSATFSLFPASGCIPRPLWFRPWTISDGLKTANDWLVTAIWRRQSGAAESGR